MRTVRWLRAANDVLIYFETGLPNTLRFTAPVHSGRLKWCSLPGACR